MFGMSLDIGCEFSWRKHAPLPAGISFRRLQLLFPEISQSILSFTIQKSSSLGDGFSYVWTSLVTDRGNPSILIEKEYLCNEWLIFLYLISDPYVHLMTLSPMSICHFHMPLFFFCIFTIVLLISIESRFLLGRVSCPEELTLPGQPLEPT